MFEVQKNTESNNPKVVKTKNERIMILSTCEVSNSKKSEFIKDQKARRLLSNLEIRTPWHQIPLLGPLFF